LNKGKGGKEADPKGQRGSRSRWLAVLAGTALLSGCCSHPGVFQKLERSLKTVQSYYDPLLKEDLMNDKMRRAVVAADTTLLLAGELQTQWCPPPEAVKQVELQVEEAQKLAQEAGLREAGAPPSDSLAKAAGL
jgi:hypothetical protein